MTRQTNAAKLVAGTATLAWLTLGACSFGPQADTSTFYVLTSIDEMKGESLGTPTSKLAVGIGPIGFPAYLARTGLVTRISDNQVDISERHKSFPVFPTVRKRNYRASQICGGKRECGY